MSSLMAKKIPSKTEIGLPGHKKQHISRKQDRGKWSFHLMMSVHFTNDEIKQQSRVGRKPFSNLFVEASACFLRSSALKKISIGIGGFLLFHSSTPAMTSSATYAAVKV